jgi:uncharacterized surface protein with fasciclin (FAS1) repeats
MKAKFLITSIGITAAIALASCSNNTTDESANTGSNEAAVKDQPKGGQSSVNDDVSQANVVKIAVQSKDHTTLVKALQAADLVNALSNNGPFTVFAPTNEAFSKLPAGTLEDLLKPENKGKLADILYHHVMVSTFKTENLTDGQALGMFDGNKEIFHKKDGKMMIGDATILGSVQASNGIVHVVDKVILPPPQK